MKSDIEKKKHMVLCLKIIFVKWEEFYLLVIVTIVYIIITGKGIIIFSL